MYFHNDYSMNEKIVFKIIVKGVFNNDRFYIFLKTSKIKVVSENIFLVDYT